MRTTRQSLDYPGFETNEEWNTRLNEQMTRQRIYRRSLSDEEKQRCKEKDTARRKELRGAKRRPLTIKEQKYLDTPLEERLWPVADAGDSFIGYMMDRLKENLIEKNDWKWLYNAKTHQEIMASEFETLVKKYAVVFSQLGVVKGDVVHFFINNFSHAHISLALGGLWTIGAIGSFGNIHKWIKTSEKYGDGSQKYNSELQLQQRQVSDCNNNLLPLYSLFSSLLGIKLSS